MISLRRLLSTSSSCLLSVASNANTITTICPSGFIGSNRKMINFAKGHPNMGLLPLEGVKEAMAKATGESNNSKLMRSLNYPKNDNGDPELIKELSSFLQRHTKDDELGSIPSWINNDVQGPSSYPSSFNEEPAAADTTNSHFFMTHGVSHGLEILCKGLTSPGDVVLIERPTYFLVKGIFKSFGLKISSLPMKSDEFGRIDVDLLEEQLSNGDLTPPRMIYIIPTHSNPTGNTMPIEDRWKLVEISKRFGIIVAADEVYHLLDWTNKTNKDGESSSTSSRRPARMAILNTLVKTSVSASSKNSDDSSSTIPAAGCCVSISSFTKIFAPGVRCGWIEGPKYIIESLKKIGYIQSQGGCTPFVGEVMRVAISEGICDQVLDHLNDSYRRRCQLLCDVLKSDSGVQIATIPQGGYFIWISFKGIDDDDNMAKFSDYCQGKGVKFLPGSRCDSWDDDDDFGSGTVATMSGLPMNACNYWARLCFADLDESELTTGANLLITCYREFISSKVCIK